MESMEVKLAKEIWELDLEIKEQQDILKSLCTRQTEKENQLMEYLASQGKTSTGHIQGVGIMSLKKESYPSVNKASMPGFIQWLRANGHSDLVEEVVAKGDIKTVCNDFKDELIELYSEDDEAAAKAHSELLVSDIKTPSELANLKLKAIGVSTFEKVTLSHTKKGK